MAHDTRQLTRGQAQNHTTGESHKLNHKKTRPAQNVTPGARLRGGIKKKRRFFGSCITDGTFPSVLSLFSFLQCALFYLPFNVRGFDFSRTRISIRCVPFFFCFGHHVYFSREERKGSRKKGRPRVLACEFCSFQHGRKRGEGKKMNAKTCPEEKSTRLTGF
jgi:hypothetical protein